MSDTENWDLEISSKKSLFDVRLNDIWHYRDLLMLLVRRDFVSFYKQTILGPIWFFIQPVITIVFYTLVFGRLAGISTPAGIPQPLFYLAGVLVWNYFSDCLIKTSTVFKDNAGLLGKVYFPRLIMPLSVVMSNLTRFAVQFILFMGLLVYYTMKSGHSGVNAYVLLFPLLVLLVAAQGLGLGMLISAVTTKYRDLAFVVGFAVPLLMYATTVIYPLTLAQQRYPAYSRIIEFNPVTAIIEFLRYGFFSSGSHDLRLLACSAISTIIILIAGVLVFNRVERDFVDTV